MVTKQTPIYVEKGYDNYSTERGSNRNDGSSNSVLIHCRLVLYMQPQPMYSSLVIIHNYTLILVINNVHNTGVKICSVGLKKMQHIPNTKRYITDFARRVTTDTCNVILLCHNQPIS